MRVAGAIAVLAAGLAACAPPGARAPLVEGPLAAAAERDGTLEAVRRGRGLYVTKCIECHGAVRPTELTVEEWDEVLPRMAKLAAITGPERADIRAYVRAALKAR